MQTLLILTGKTADKDIDKLTSKYVDRIKHYIQFDVAVVPDLKNTAKLTTAQINQAEGTGIQKFLRPGDHVILLDEHGAEMSSVKFSEKLNKFWTYGAPRRLVFIIGGPYGFSPEVQSLANEKISLSQMTFSHQMVRMIFAEQLYRALTILNNEPYHHE